SDATRAFGVALVGLTVVFGLYMISHGQTTPGGGLQGGVILATAPLSVYLAADARTFQRIAPRSLGEWAGSLAAAGYVVLGPAAFVFLCGLWGAATSRHLVHLVICVGVLQTSTYVLLLAVGQKAGGVAPVYYGVPHDLLAVDPVVQALMLTDVVVEATVVALLLALAVQAHKH